MESIMPDATKYRLLHLVHLGGAEPPTQLSKGEEVSFDGSTLKRANGDVIKIPQPEALAGAIRVGWMVPVESQKTSFTPQPAGVEVRSALSTGDKRSVVSVMTVADEERDLGHISKVRPEGAPEMHVAGSAGEISREPGAQAKIPLETRDSDDGVVVGRMKLSSQSDPVEIGKGDDKIRQKLDMAAPVQVIRVARASGDVQEAMAGEDLESILPEAVSTGRPKAGVYADEGVTVSSTGSSTGGAEDGTVVAQVTTAPPSVNMKDPEGTLRSWADNKETQISTQDLRVLVRAALRKIDALRPAAESAAKATAPVSENGESEFQWDTSEHWKVRVMKATQVKTDKAQLEQILAAETSDGVKKAVRGLIAELS